MTDDQLAAFRREHLGRLLLEAAGHFQQQAIERLHQIGYRDYRLTHNALMTHLGLDGARLGQLAERAGITKQSMQAIADELESLGYVVRKPDPKDGRARVICFSPRGRRFLRDAVKVLQDVIDEYAKVTGAARIQRLTRDLRALVRDLNIELP